MPIKETRVSNILTPAAKLASAQDVLERPADPQTRWTPGALSASIMGAFQQPLDVFISPGKVVAFLSSENVAFYGFLDDNGVVPSQVLTFSAAESASKSKPLELADFAMVISPTVDGVAVTPQTNPVVFGVMVPEPPTYTALALVNRLENLSLANNVGYVIEIRQDTEEIVFTQFATAAGAETEFTSFADSEKAKILAAFDTVAESSSAPIVRHGWE